MAEQARWALTLYTSRESRESRFDDPPSPSPPPLVAHLELRIKRLESPQILKWMDLAADGQRQAARPRAAGSIGRKERRLGVRFF